ncbi:MAG: putative transporter [Paludibacteraceae bacterium]|nr:putative transporter [Paludibacteraceae bacterium]
MDYLRSLFLEPGITQSLMVLVLTVATGLFLAEKLKIKTFSLGVTWILFCGIIFSHFGLRLDPAVSHFAKDFGLILFVYSIGLQVGPSFFSSFGKGGLRLNGFAALIVVLACITTWVIARISGEDMATMVGVMSGAVTNTPSLGAAEQAYADAMGDANPAIATGYAVAYPLGVLGIIFSMLLIKWVFRINLRDEEALLHSAVGKHKEPVLVDILISNPQITSITIRNLHHMINVPMVISRIIHPDKSETVPQAETDVQNGDTLRILADREHLDMLSLLGPIEEKKKTERTGTDSTLISRRIVVTKPEWNGKQIRHLGVNDRYHVTITRVNRAGIDLIATSELHLQLGDRIMVVGSKVDVEKVADIFGNELKRLDIPNLLPIFFGIVLGVVVGTLPIAIPGLSQPFKLGLAGGSLIVAILIGRFGPYYHMVTFSTTSANMMIREIGISLFLASVGLGAGESFVPTIAAGGWVWIIYGAIITLLPLIVVGFCARKWGKLNYFTLMGLIAGSTTDPPALAYAVGNSTTTDQASVAYATVYPLTMFLRVMLAQIMILTLI